MTTNTSLLERLIGLTVYVKIYDQLGRGIQLVKDSKEGYLYKGRVTGVVLFENGDLEEHFSIALEKPIIVHKSANRLEMLDLLATPRYQGESMSGLLDSRVIVASCSHIRGISYSAPSVSYVLKLKKASFDSDDFVWIGIGELSIRPSEKPFSDAPWDMYVSKDTESHT